MKWPKYRLFRLNRDSGHLEPWLSFRAENDPAAIELAVAASGHEHFAHAGHGFDRQAVADGAQQRRHTTSQSADGLDGVVQDQPDVIDRARLGRDPAALHAAWL